MTNKELKDKIVALWKEYQAEAPEEDDTVLYLCITQDGAEKNETTIAAAASPRFLQFVVADFMTAIAKQDLEAVKGFLRKLVEKLVEVEAKGEE